MIACDPSKFIFTEMVGLWHSWRNRPHQTSVPLRSVLQEYISRDVLYPSHLPPNVSLYIEVSDGAGKKFEIIGCINVSFQCFLVRGRLYAKPYLWQLLTKAEDKRF